MVTNYKTLLEKFKSKRLNVCVLMGGNSPEREISLKSGTAIANALLSSGFKTTLFDIHHVNEIYKILYHYDIFFIALHGDFGEDGTIQSVFEENDIAYTGSDSASSKNAIDKFISKEIFIKKKINTPPAMFSSKNNSLSKIKKFFEASQDGIVIKPRNQGSSVGVSIIRKSPPSLNGLSKIINSALHKASKYCDDVIIENFIKGKEVTVGILGERTLPVIELKPARDFFDYSAKYLDKNTQYLVNPREIDEKTKKAIQKEAYKAHKALGCSVFSRVDMILDERTNKPVVLEVNSIPGMTERSLVPKAASEAGISFDELCQKILYLSIIRKQSL